MKFQVHWDSGLIVLSVAIAFIGAYVAIVLSEQFRLCSTKENRPKLLSKGTILWVMALSCGGIVIWYVQQFKMPHITNRHVCCIALECYVNFLGQCI
jgi:NO-binding membrane sensor protein with MHYT domain